MTSHHRLPSSALALLLFCRVAGGIADGCGIDEDLCPLKCHETGCLGVPLIPANHDAQTTYRGLNGMETEIARGEVELLVVGRIIGDVHLAIDACDGAILFEYYCRIVVKSCCPALKE